MNNSLENDEDSQHDTLGEDSISPGDEEDPVNDKENSKAVQEGDNTLNENGPKTTQTTASVYTKQQPLKWLKTGADYLAAKKLFNNAFTNRIVTTVEEIEKIDYTGEAIKLKVQLKIRLFIMV